MKIKWLTIQQNFTNLSQNFARLLNVSEEDFKASTGWLDRFKKQNDIRRFKIQGESE
ncbi:4545_t:CDS:2, partial [Racocetra fulgida]